ncbi:unnamed protein product, partial [Staurois parvus]
MGPPGNRGSWGPCVLAKTQKKAYEKRYQGHLMGPPTDPGQCPSFQMVSPPLGPVPLWCGCGALIAIQNVWLQSHRTHI